MSGQQVEARTLSGLDIGAHVQVERGPGGRLLAVEQRDDFVFVELASSEDTRFVGKRIGPARLVTVTGRSES